VKPPIVAVFEDFRNILGVCPCCGEVFRLSDLQLSYRGTPRRTWLDALEAAEDRQERAEERFEEREGAIRAAAQERGRRQLPKLLRKAEPIFSVRGYYPQDAKALFDPVDFIIFHGMNREKDVKRVVLFDGPPGDKARERVQRSVRRALRAGNVSWRTVRLSKDGKIDDQRK
jgi:predicted Holliday junction resolvase-like endonuclease